MSSQKSRSVGKVGVDQQSTIKCTTVTHALRQGVRSHQTRGSRRDVPEAFTLEQRAEGQGERVWGGDESVGAKGDRTERRASATGSGPPFSMPVQPGPVEAERPVQPVAPLACGSRLLSLSRARHFLAGHLLCLVPDLGSFLLTLKVWSYTCQPASCPSVQDTGTSPPQSMALTRPRSREAVSRSEETREPVPCSSVKTLQAARLLSHPVDTKPSLKHTH